MKKKKISILCDVYRPIPYGYPICRSSDMNRCAPVFFGCLKFLVQNIRLSVFPVDFVAFLSALVYL